MRFPRTHDLVRLVGMVDPPEPRLNVLGPRLGDLSSYAVDVRYPGPSPTESEVVEAMCLAREVREVCLDLLRAQAQ